MIAESNLKKTTVIRNNEGMIRDFWWEADTKEPEKKIFVLRQITVQPDQTVKSKIMRLTEPEWKEIRRALTGANETSS